MSMLDSYWSFMLDCYYGMQLVQGHRRANWRLERFLDIILAIISTGSLAVLLAWDEAQVFSAIVISVSQIISSIRPYLPSGQRVESLSGVAPLMSREYDKIENDYRSLCGGGVADADIDALLRSHSEAWCELVSEVDKLILSDNKNISDYAVKETVAHFKLMFGAECAGQASKENK